MNMKTELNVVPHDIQPGRKIDVQEYRCMNFNLHTCLTHLSNLMMGNIESAMNNMSAAAVPRDIANFHAGYQVFKTAYQFAIDHNNPPQTSHEYGYAVLLPTLTEIMRMPNVKSKVVNQHIFRLCHVILSTDAAKVGGNIDVASAQTINEQIVITEEAILLWMGKGADNSDVGISVPLFKHLGVVDPDFDFDKATTNEPSPNRPNTGMPDVPDIIGNAK